MREIFFFLFLLQGLAFTAPAQNVEWKADFYERDLKSNTLKGRGHAWFKQDSQQIWADEIEINFTTNWAFASGNAHFSDGTNDIYCERGSYSLDGKEAILENGMLIAGQMVITGMQLRKMSKYHYEIDEGIYTNCNTIPIRDKTASVCTYDWKIYGKHFKVVVEGYAQVYDGIIYAKDLPIAYFPYYIAPAKSKRQTGLLWFNIETGPRTGTGYGMPFFWAIGPWHDLTFSPKYHTGSKWHFGLQYNYAYSNEKAGQFNVYTTQMKYSDDKSSQAISNTRSAVGEWAVDIHNRYSLWGRAHSIQNLTLVSDPRYTIDHKNDLGDLGEKAALRSQFAAIVPGDSDLLTGQVRHFQSLVMSSDPGPDKGAVTELPSIAYYRKNSPTLIPFVSYETDFKISNYYRGGNAFDIIPDSRLAAPSGRTDFGGNDYVREGRRLILEPRLLLNFPIASGFQLQPIIKGGTYVYHFDVPNSSFSSQQYADVEIPFQLYLAKTFKTGVTGFEEVRHVFQPRLIYASALYRSTTPTHPFFNQASFDQKDQFSNPRFDILDQITNFEYMRIELINRFLRINQDSRDRFLLLQISNQFNSRISPFDRRYRSHMGPLEMLLEFTMGRVSLQMQGNYELEKVGNTNQSDWSSSISYSAPEGDAIRLSGLYRVRDNEATNEQRYSITAIKALPKFIDLSATVNYNARKQLAIAFEAYEFGIRFASKPTSCWDLAVLYTKTATGDSYSRFVFGLNFGGPIGTTSKQAGI